MKSKKVYSIALTGVIVHRSDNTGYCTAAVTNDACYKCAFCLYSIPILGKYLCQYFEKKRGHHTLGLSDVHLCLSLP